MKLLLSVLIILLTSSPTKAQEYTYAPQGCDFKITFPEEPHTTRRCHTKIADRCDLMSGYTKVFGLDATVNFYVSCKPNEEDLRESFTPDVLRTSLLARPYVESLEVYDINHGETDLAKMSALFGAGPTDNGNDVMLYVAQIWVGENSTLSLEGEIIGHDVPEADELFADILASLHHKDGPPPTEPKDSETEPSENESEPQVEGNLEKAN